jgi:lysozyme
MKRSTIALVVVPGFFLLQATSWTLAQSEADWQVLTDDASREQLFEEYIKPSRTEAESSGDIVNPPVSFNIPKEFFFPADALTDKANGNKPRGDVVFGIDISHHSDTVDFTRLPQQKVGFVYVKATQGTGFKDGEFGDNWARLGQLPPHQVYRGAYHFLTAKGSAEDQAKSFLAYLKLHGSRPDDLPPCMDLEWDVGKNNPDQWKGHESEIIPKALAFLTAVEKATGRTPVIYTARSWWRDRGLKESDFAKFDHFPIWIADYSTSHKAAEKPAVINGRTQTMWQFADDAFLTAGYKKKLDANIFYGTPQAFRASLGIPEP